MRGAGLYLLKYSSHADCASGFGGGQEGAERLPGCRGGMLRSAGQVSGGSSAAKQGGMEILQTQTLIIIIMYINHGY